MLEQRNLINQIDYKKKNNYNGLLMSGDNLGKYLLEDKIASGGMAEIFKASFHGASGFEKKVCIKRILPKFNNDEDFVRMFIDEAKLAAQLNNANIVHIYEFDKIDGYYYIAMELVEGIDLKKLLKKVSAEKTKIPVSIIVYILSEILKGLHYAHTKRIDEKDLGIIHRDITPHNILLSNNGEVKITDFGIAKSTSRLTITQSGVIKGKLRYMSPEQVLREGIDQRSDLFSTGIIGFEMLIGKHLFDGKNEGEIIESVSKCHIPAIIEFRPDINEELIKIIEKLLQKNKADRYSDAYSALLSFGKLNLTSPTIQLELGEYIKSFNNQEKDNHTKTLALSSDCLESIKSFNDDVEYANSDEITRTKFKIENNVDSESNSNLNTSIISPHDLFTQTLVQQDKTDIIDNSSISSENEENITKPHNIINKAINTEAINIATAATILFNQKEIEKARIQRYVPTEPAVNYKKKASKKNNKFLYIIISLSIVFFIIINILLLVFAMK